MYVADEWSGVHATHLIAATLPRMSHSHKPDEAGGEHVGEEKPVAPEPKKTTGKTLQELERIQFDALDRAGFDRN